MIKTVYYSVFTTRNYNIQKMMQQSSAFRSYFQLDFSAYQ